SVRYLGLVRPFHYRAEEDIPEPQPAGGFFWDGRADSIAALTAQPLLNPDEMGNRDARAIDERLRTAPYARDFVAAFGSWSTPEDSLRHLGEAIEAFLRSEEMSPFSSKYDDFLRGKVTLSPDESQGLALFKNVKKGNCASCHKMNDRSPDPRRS